MRCEGSWGVLQYLPGVRVTQKGIQGCQFHSERCNHTTFSEDLRQLNHAGRRTELKVVRGTPGGAFLPKAV